jgi:hypothetical protein
MSKAIFTISFLVMLLGLVILRNNEVRMPSLVNWRAFQSAFQSKSAANPEDAIYSMLDAARAGNAKAYVEAFGGPMHDQLVQLVNESTEPKFSAYLTTQNAAFQGVAVAITDRPSAEKAEARLEYVYSDRNEIQKFYLTKEQGRWRILRVAGSERIKTLVPFGTATTD